jgi:hypothetical protein
VDPASRDLYNAGLARLFLDFVVAKGKGTMKRTTVTKKSKQPAKNQDVVLLDGSSAIDAFFSRVPTI